MTAELARRGRVIDAEFEDPAATIEERARFPSPPSGYVYLVTAERVYLMKVTDIDIREQGADIEKEKYYGTDGGRNFAEPCHWAIRLSGLAQKFRAR